MYIKICINSAKLPPNIYNSFVEYKVFGKSYRTEVQPERGDTVYFGYERIHFIKEVDDYVLDTLARNKI